MVESLETDIAFDYICNQDARRNDEIMQAMPEATVVVIAQVLHLSIDPGLFGRLAELAQSAR